jgi:hypothetical protein
MPLNQGQGLFLTNDVLLGPWIEDVPQVTQLAGVFRIDQVPGNEVRYATTGALATAGVIDYGGAPLADQTTVPEERVYTFGNLGTARVVNWSTQDLQSSPIDPAQQPSSLRDQTQEQIAKAARQLHYKFWELFITGNPATPGEFAGLNTILAGAAFAGRTVAKAGTAITLPELDAYIRTITSGDNRNVAILASNFGAVMLNNLFNAAGLYSPPVACSYMDFGGRQITRMCQSAFGIPVFWNTAVPVTPGPPGQTISDLYFLNLGAGHIRGIIPPLNGASTMIKIRETSLGATEPATRYDITFPIGVDVPSTADLFRAADVLNPVTL